MFHIAHLSTTFLTPTQNEKFSETKNRIEKRIGIHGKNFEKIKFAVVKRSSYTKPIYLNDGIAKISNPPLKSVLTLVLDSILDEAITAEDDLLGLDHQDRTRPRGNGTGDLFLK